MFWIFFSRNWLEKFCFTATLIIEHYPLLFLPSTESVFYRDSSSYEGITNQIIWNNKYILGVGKSIFQSVFYNLGILKVGDLVSSDGVFLKNDEILNSSFSPWHSFSLMGVLDAIPKGMAF